MEHDLASLQQTVQAGGIQKVAVNPFQVKIFQGRMWPALKDSHPVSLIDQFTDQYISNSPAGPGYRNLHGLKVIAYGKKF